MTVQRKKRSKRGAQGRNTLPSPVRALPRRTRAFRPTVGDRGTPRTRPPEGVGAASRRLLSDRPAVPRRSAGKARTVRRTNPRQGADPAGLEAPPAPHPLPDPTSTHHTWPRPRAESDPLREAGEGSPCSEGKEEGATPARPDPPCRRRICRRSSSFSSISRVRDARPGPRDVIAPRPFPSGRGAGG